MKNKKRQLVSDNREIGESETHRERLMIEYYRTMSAEQHKYLEKALPVIGEIVKGWDEG